MGSVKTFFQFADRARFGDPMAHLVRQKEAAPPPPVIPERMARQMKKSGFVVPQASPLSPQKNFSVCRSGASDKLKSTLGHSCILHPLVLH